MVVLLLEAAGVLRHAFLHPPQKGQSTLVLAHISPFNDVCILVDRSQVGAIWIQWVFRFRFMQHRHERSRTLPTGERHWNLNPRRPSRHHFCIWWLFCLLSWIFLNLKFPRHRPARWLDDLLAVNFPQPNKFSWLTTHYIFFIHFVKLEKLWGRSKGQAAVNFLRENRRQGDGFLASLITFQAARPQISSPIVIAIMNSTENTKIYIFFRLQLYSPP